MNAWVQVCPVDGVGSVRTPARSKSAEAAHVRGISGYRAGRSRNNRLVARLIVGSAWRARVVR